MDLIQINKNIDYILKMLPSIQNVVQFMKTIYIHWWPLPMFCMFVQKTNQLKHFGGRAGGRFYLYFF